MLMPNPKTKPCPVVIRPAGMGRSMVRFISLSRSTSITSLKQLAAAVTKKPPVTSFNQLIHMVVLYNDPQVLPPFAFTAMIKDIDAENTTRNVSLNLISFEKSAHFIFALPVYSLIDIN